MNDIVCQNCGSRVEITSSLRAQVETDLKKDFDTKLEAMRASEIKLLKEKAILEEAQKNLELETARKLDASRKQIEEGITRQLSQHFNLIEDGYKKQIEDLKKLAEEAGRKAAVTSQQHQGETQEISLKSQLIQYFPDDEIDDVEKGVRGADLRQIVKTPRGNICGVILWESKRTQSWSDDWLNKLKEDLRAEKANIPVIVTQTLPKDQLHPVEFRDGVWISNWENYLGIASSLRLQLIEVAKTKYFASQKGTKSELIYDYITGHEFVQQIQAMADVYTETLEQINRERAAFERIWKSRESHALRLRTSIGSVFGSLQGLAGPALPTIPQLDLLEN